MTFVAPMGLMLDDPALANDVTIGLAAVEELLDTASDHADPFIAETSYHLTAAGGKRFRPLLVLLAAQFGDPRAHIDQIVKAAAMVELTHLATLYHDDVMDAAPTRRGAASANTLWGNKVAVLTGDLLFTHATKLVATLGAEAILIQAETVARLVAGQIRETVGPAEGDDPIKHYQSVLRDKTGSLIATSCRLGALLAGAPESTVDTLTEFGELIGICFQLSDDLLDVVADSDVSGKALGADLREGLATLPVLYALESRDPADVALHELLRDDLQDTHRLAEALKLLRIHPAIDRAREEVADYAAEAKALLKPLPDIPAKKALTLLCKAATYRSS